MSSFTLLLKKNDIPNFHFYRNLCIDGGYEICAEMYNKNILAPLSTFVPKVCLVILHARPNCTAPNDLSVYSDWVVQLTFGGFFFPNF